jgi:uncharacterized protein (TIGR02646 family)
MAVRPEYIFRVNVAYVKTAADNVEIAADDDANKKWKYAYKTFKPRIRNHLKGQQNGRCAFCRCIVNVGTSYANLEHIVSKSDYSQFKTLPQNLVYSCWLCNKSKKKRNTIDNPEINRELQVFPTTADGFVIVNPYYDNYEAHIDFLDEVIVIRNNNSTKGANTIEFYNLARPELAEERAREFKLNQNYLTQQLLLRLTDMSTPPDVLAQVNGIIAQMPIWTL